MFFCTMSAFFITLTANLRSVWLFLWHRNTLPKAPRLIGFRIWKSSMEGARPRLEAGLEKGHGDQMLNERWFRVYPN
jgi:hypothetical protein